MVSRTLAPSCSSRRSARRLAAACIAATLGLTACDANIETAREAQKDADQAVRIAASAGQPRATDKLLETVAATPLADRSDLSKKLGTGGDYVRQETPEKDLVAATTQINQALKSDLAQDLKASLQAEAAAIHLQLAGHRFNALHQRLEEISTRAMELQTTAQLAIDLGGEATSISATVKPPTSEEVDKAKTAVSNTDAALQKAQQDVESIQRDIAAKQEQARGIYSRTQAAFQQADTLKGKEAIDAGNKAIEESKQGDALMAEAGNLEPKLAAARTALAIAQVQQKDAQRQLATATAAFEAGNTWVRQNTERTTSLQAQAKKIVSDPKGVAEQYTQLVKLVNDLDPEIKSAFDAAEQARSSYGAARQANDTALGALSAKVTEQQLESSDPLVKVARDMRSSALLSWGQSAAAEQGGRVQAAGYTAAGMLSSVKTLVDKAYQAAGMTAPAATLPDRSTYQTKAAAAFSAAVEAAKAGTDRSSPELDRIKWIGWSLQALANQGLALVATDRAQATTFTAAAKSAAANATNIGPDGHGNPDVAPQLRRAGIEIAG